MILPSEGHLGRLCFMYNLTKQVLYQIITSQIPGIINTTTKKKKKLPCENSLVRRTFQQNTKYNTIKFHREFRQFFGAYFPGFWSTLVLLTKRTTENHSHTKCLHSSNPQIFWGASFHLMFRVQGNRSSWLGAPKAVGTDSGHWRRFFPICHCPDTSVAERVPEFRERQQINVRNNSVWGCLFSDSEKNHRT